MWISKFEKQLVLKASENIGFIHVQVSMFYHSLQFRLVPRNEHQCTRILLHQQMQPSWRRCLMALRSPLPARSLFFYFGAWGCWCDAAFFVWRDDFVWEAWIQWLATIMGLCMVAGSGTHKNLGNSTFQKEPVQCWCIYQFLSCLFSLYLFIEPLHACATNRRVVPSYWPFASSLANVPGVSCRSVQLVQWLSLTIKFGD